MGLNDKPREPFANLNLRRHRTPRVNVNTRTVIDVLRRRAPKYLGLV